jgi:hypothetical protein
LELLLSFFMQVSVIAGARAITIFTIYRLKPIEILIT